MYGTFWRKYICVIELWMKAAAFFMVHHFYLEKKKDWLRNWLFINGYLAGFSHKNVVSLLCWGRILTVFVAHYEIQGFKQKLEVWKICICHLEPKNFPILFNTFPMKSIVIFTNVIDFWYCLMKPFNIWNICVTQRINILQKTDAQCYKILYK